MLKAAMWYCSSSSRVVDRIPIVDYLIIVRCVGMSRRQIPHGGIVEGAFLAVVLIETRLDKVNKRPHCESVKAPDCLNLLYKLPTRPTRK